MLRAAGCCCCCCWLADRASGTVLAQHNRLAVPRLAAFSSLAITNSQSIHPNQSHEAGSRSVLWLLLRRPQTPPLSPETPSSETRSGAAAVGWSRLCRPCLNLLPPGPAPESNPVLRRRRRRQRRRQRQRARRGCSPTKRPTQAGSPRSSLALRRLTLSRLTPSSQRPPATGQRPAATSQQPAASGLSPTRWQGWLACRGPANRGAGRASMQRVAAGQWSAEAPPPAPSKAPSPLQTAAAQSACRPAHQCFAAPTTSHAACMGL